MADYGGDTCHKCYQWVAYNTKHECDKEFVNSLKVDTKRRKAEYNTWLKKNRRRIKKLEAARNKIDKQLDKIYGES